MSTLQQIAQTPYQTHALKGMMHGFYAVPLSDHLAYHKAQAARQMLDGRYDLAHKSIQAALKPDGSIVLMEV